MAKGEKYNQYELHHLLELLKKHSIYLNGWEATISEDGYDIHGVYTVRILTGRGAVILGLPVEQVTYVPML